MNLCFWQEVAEICGIYIKYTILKQNLYEDTAFLGPIFSGVRSIW